MSAKPDRRDLRERVQRAALHTRAGRRARRELIAVENLVRGLEMFDRPAWLYRSRGAIPRAEIHHRAPRAVGESDLDLCLGVA